MFFQSGHCLVLCPFQRKNSNPCRGSRVQHCPLLRKTGKLCERITKQDFTVQFHIVYLVYIFFLLQISTANHQNYYFFLCQILLKTMKPLKGHRGENIFFSPCSFRSSVKNTDYSKMFFLSRWLILNISYSLCLYSSDFSVWNWHRYLETSPDSDTFMLQYIIPKNREFV